MQHLRLVLCRVHAEHRPRALWDKAIGQRLEQVDGAHTGDTRGDTVGERQPRPLAGLDPLRLSLEAQESRPPAQQLLMRRQRSVVVVQRRTHRTEVHHARGTSNSNWSYTACPMVLW